MFGAKHSFADRQRPLGTRQRVVVLPLLPQVSRVLEQPAPLFQRALVGRRRAAGDERDLITAARRISLRSADVEAVLAGGRGNDGQCLGALHVLGVVDFRLSRTVRSNDGCCDVDAALLDENAHVLVCGEREVGRHVSRRPPVRGRRAGRVQGRDPEAAPRSAAKTWPGAARTAEGRQRDGALRSNGATPDRGQPLDLSSVILRPASVIGRVWFCHARGKVWDDILIRR